MNLFARCALALAVTLGAVGTAHAEDWFVRFGPTYIDPKSDNGSLAGGTLDVNVKSQTGLGLAFGYQFTPNLAVELLGSSVYEHSVQLNGDTAVDFKHLPPTLSVQYYFAPESKVNPFVGLGVNYTLTFDENERGALAGTKVSVGDSFGVAAQGGLLFKVNDRWDVIADVRWIDLDAKVKVNGAKVGTANVDPLVYSLHLGYRF